MSAVPGVAQQRLDLAALVAGRRAEGEARAVAAGPPAAGVLGGVERGVGGSSSSGASLGVVGVARRRRPSTRAAGRRPARRETRCGRARRPRGRRRRRRRAGRARTPRRRGGRRRRPRGRRRAARRRRARARGRPRRGRSESLMRLKWSRSRTTTLTGRRRRRRLERRAQALLAAAVVEQAGEAVGADLLAQEVALAGRVVGERGHRREALDERDLGVGERDVGAGAVDVERADDAVVGEQRDADERLGVLVGARDDGAQRSSKRCSGRCACGGCGRPSR